MANKYAQLNSSWDKRKQLKQIKEENKLDLTKTSKDNRKIKFTQKFSDLIRINENFFRHHIFNF